MKGMKKTIFAVAAVAAMVLSVLACVQIVPGTDVEGTDSWQTGTGTSTEPFTTTVKISDGQTKVSDIYINETAFVFNYYFQLSEKVGNDDATTEVISIPEMTLEITTTETETTGTKTTVTDYIWDPTVSSWVDKTGTIRFDPSSGKYYQKIGNATENEMTTIGFDIIYKGTKYTYDDSTKTWKNTDTSTSTVSIISILQDGVIIEYGTSGDYFKWASSTSHKILSVEDTQPSISNNGTCTATITGVSDSNSERGGYRISFAASGVTKDSATGSTLYVKYTVTSQGESQTFHYLYNIYMYKAFVFTNFSFQKGNGVIGGTFESDLGITNNNSSPTYTTTDTVNFRYYATGLPSGVSLVVTNTSSTDGTLAIKGSVPESVRSKEWSGYTLDGTDGKYTGTMTLSFAVTDIRTGYVVLNSVGDNVNNGVSVSFDLNDSNALVYTLNYDGNPIADQADGDKAVTVVSSDNKILLLTGNDNNVVDIVRKNASGAVIETSSSTLSSVGVNFDITGTGFYELHIRVPGIAENVVTVSIIDDLIPVNNIVVTCGPATECIIILDPGNENLVEGASNVLIKKKESY